MRIAFTLLAVTQLMAGAELIDQIAVVVNKTIIKDSDIARDLRATQFLNGEAPNSNATERQKSARKLIDQVFLREEIRTGGYKFARDEEVTAQVAALRQSRFGPERALETALEKYKLSPAELWEQLRWQLTVLHFIDARFKPAAIVEDSAVDAYYRQHEAQLRKSNPKGSVEQLRTQAREILVNEEVDRLLFAWLDQRRKDSKVVFHEGGLG